MTEQQRTDEEQVETPPAPQPDLPAAANVTAEAEVVHADGTKD